MSFDAVVICDGSLRVSRLAGEIIASIGVAVMIDGVSILDISECLPKWESIDITAVEYLALAKGLERALELNLRSLRIHGDNECALDLFRRYVAPSNSKLPKEIRRKLRALGGVEVTKASKEEIRRAHDLANRAGMARLSEIYKRRCDTGTRRLLNPTQE